jgi:hypothetical protein
MGNCPIYVKYMELLVKYVPSGQISARENSLGASSNILKYNVYLEIATGRARKYLGLKMWAE